MGKYLIQVIVIAALAAVAAHFAQQYLLDGEAVSPAVTGGVVGGVVAALLARRSKTA